MNTSLVMQEKKEERLGAAQQSGAEIQSIIGASEEGRPQERQMHALEMLFGTTMSVMCGEYDIPGLEVGTGTVLDIGANEGAFSVWALFRWPSAKVIAYEPCAATFSELSQRLQSEPRITRINAAVTEKENPFLRYGVHCNQENSIHDIGCQRPEGEVVKTVKPFDLPEAKFLKIDTEGCELEILRSYLNKHKPDGIALEWHSLEDRLAIGDLLRGKGYYVTESPNVPVCISKGVYIGIMKAILPR